MPTAAYPSKLMRIPAAAERLDVSEDTLRRLIRRGEFPAVRVGTQLRIDPNELETWLHESRATQVLANPVSATRPPAVEAVERVGAPGPERST